MLWLSLCCVCLLFTKHRCLWFLIGSWNPRSIVTAFKWKVQWTKFSTSWFQKSFSEPRLYMWSTRHRHHQRGRRGLDCEWKEWVETSRFSLPGMISLTWSWLLFSVSHKTQMRAQMEEKVTCVGKRDPFQRNLVGQLHVRGEKRLWEKNLQFPTSVEDCGEMEVCISLVSQDVRRPPPSKRTHPTWSPRRTVAMHKNRTLKSNKAQTRSPAGPNYQRLTKQYVEPSLQIH